MTLKKWIKNHLESVLKDIFSNSIMRISELENLAFVCLIFL